MPPTGPYAAGTRRPTAALPDPLDASVSLVDPLGQGRSWVRLASATALRLDHKPLHRVELRRVDGQALHHQPGFGPGVHLAGRPPIHPERFSGVRAARRPASLLTIRLHEVRHGYVTAALAAGVPAKVVSGRLGHATIAITMATYSHVLPGLDAQAADAVASSLALPSRARAPLLTNR
jgi:integrase